MYGDIVMNERNVVWNVHDEAHQFEWEIIIILPTVQTLLLAIFSFSQSYWAYYVSEVITSC